MQWTSNPVFLPKYAERLRMGNVRMLPTQMVDSLTKVFQQLKDIGAPRALEVRIRKRPTAAERKIAMNQLRRDLQRSIEMLDGE